MSKNTQTVRLDQLLTGAQLPALPQSAIRLLELSRDPDNGPAEFAVPIESDPGLASQVLRFVNSSYFGFSREISSVKLAISLVGIRTVKNFSLWSAVFSLVPNPRCGQFDLKALWKDSLRRGLLARTLGSRLRLDASEDLFSAALLQDMAVPLLAKELPNEYREMFESRDHGRRRLSDLEMERFGWNHADAAAHMARVWNLPESFVDLIRGHVHTSQWLESGNQHRDRLAISLTALLPADTDGNWHDREAFLQTYQALVQGQGTELAEVFAQVDSEFAEFAPIMKISGHGMSLCDSLAQPTACGP